MNALVFLFVGFLALLFFVRRWSRRFDGFLESQGIPVAEEPAAFWNFHLVNWHEWDRRCQRKFGGVWGRYVFGGLPEVFVTDPDVLKDVFVKQFEAFPNRTSFGMPDKHASLLDGQSEKWRKMRKALSPTFTSGKIKGMFEPVHGVVDEMVSHIEKLLAETPDGVINLKPIFQCLSLDSISNCAFGVTTNSFTNPQNDIFKTCIESFSSFTLSNVVDSFMSAVAAGFPIITNMVDTYGAKSFDFLYQTTKSIVENRQQPKGDFVDRLKEIRATNVLTEDQTYAQGIGFFQAGFETTSNTLCTLSYNLAKNPDVQDKLYAEVKSVLDKYDGRIDHDTIGEMPYLDACLLEDLRICSPVVRTDRMCHKDCKIGDLNIKEGVRVVIPIHAIHYNPVLYPDPEKFDPDRFLGDDGSKAGSSTLEYLPFGAGPRVCIGMRFAMTEMKIATAKLLSKFKLLDDPKTALEYDTGDVFLLSYPGINIKVERRSQ